MTTSRPLRSALAAACGVTLAAGLGAGSAQAATATDGCTNPALTQPFTAFKDSHLYTLAPGGRFDGADGAWTLSGGAAIVSTTQDDGTTGGVLDLPSNAVATSPVVCITSDYPTARAWVRNVAGSEGVSFNISYFVNGVWTPPKNTGQFHGDHTSWTPSNPMNIQPYKTTGWQQVRFTFVAGGKTSRFQVDDFWVDPRMRA